MEQLPIQPKKQENKKSSGGGGWRQQISGIGVDKIWKVGGGVGGRVDSIVESG